MYRFTYPLEKYQEQNLNKQDILHLIHKHIAFNRKLLENKRYFDGKHAILDRKKSEGAPNNRLVCNHAADIVTTATSYFGGNPITYKSDYEIDSLLDAFEFASVDDIDGDNIQDLSVYGLAYEYIYVKEKETQPVSKTLTPLNTFMVHDDTIEENELFAVYYYAQKDDTDKTPTRYAATVLTANYKYVLRILDHDEYQPVDETPEKHFFGEIPVIEYQNNKDAKGDFEGVIPLMDAYNLLMSDRVDDKEQFIDSILAIYGTLLSDDNEESEAMKALKELGLLELPLGSKAEYITRTFNENEVEILKKAIEQDIHKFSHIPCLSDESFAGNTSGVAMEYKLLGLENIAKIKSRYYRKGAKKRIRLYNNFLQIKGRGVDITGITAIFTRGLPKNLLELSQIVANLWGKVSKRTLLSQLPFVTDVNAELESIKKESEEALQQQQAMFGIGINTPPEGGEDDAEEE